jgi:RNA polymerase sigma-70 factor (ECF subfamily)
MHVSHDEFVLLLTQELDAVDRVAKSLTRNSARADDLVQETCLAALRARHQFNLHDFGIRPWLLRILHNTHLNREKRERRQPLPMESQVLEAAAPPAAAPSSMNSGDFDDLVLNHALDQLAPDLRTIMILWAVDELSYKEMAHVLDIPIGTVMSRIHRARQRLYELLPKPIPRQGIPME